MTAKHVPPYFRCDWDLPTASGIQALQRGEATPQQQKDFLNWLVNTAAATYNVSFDVNSDRASSFAEGRRFVGLQCVKLLTLNTRAFVKKGA